MAGSDGIEVELLSTGEAHDLAAAKCGPFLPGIRIHCPERNFAWRKTEHCSKCAFLRGIGKREIEPALDHRDPVNATRLYKILCGHPMSRGIAYFPED